MLLKNLKHMVTKIRSYLGIKPLPEVSLEVQVRNTTFRSSYPDSEDYDPKSTAAYNRWTVYLRKQLYSKKRRSSSKKIA